MRVEVQARRFATDSGVEVQSGDRLEVRAEGQWRDWFITCGPEGYAAAHLRPFEGLRRDPTAAWFELLAAIGPDGPPIRIGRGRTFAAAQAGRVMLFANDVPGMYWNNAGSLSVTVSRIADGSRPDGAGQGGYHGA